MKHGKLIVPFINEFTLSSFEIQENKIKYLTEKSESKDIFINTMLVDPERYSFNVKFL